MISYPICWDPPVHLISPFSEFKILNIPSLAILPRWAMMVSSWAVLITRINSTVSHCVKWSNCGAQAETWIHLRLISSLVSKADLEEIWKCRRLKLQLCQCN